MLTTKGQFLIIYQHFSFEEADRINLKTYG